MNNLQNLTYNALMYLLAPAWLIVTCLQAVRRKGGWLFLSSRMGWRAPANTVSNHLTFSIDSNPKPVITGSGTDETDKAVSDRAGADTAEVCAAGAPSNGARTASPCFAATETPTVTDSEETGNTKLNVTAVAADVAVATVKPTVRPLWLHAASVGEVKSILPLLDHISISWPLLPIHVTCTTPESLGLLQRSALKALTSEYCPIDFHGAINTLIKRLNPLALIIIETEIWPNLYSLANRQAIPLIIVNGRASEKTTNAPAFVLRLYQQVLQHVDLMLARSEQDATNFQTLGIKPQHVKTIGNIKTYIGNTAPPAPLPELATKRYILAASTHHPEEQQLADALSKTNILLVIAPRHVQRSNSIQQLFRTSNIRFSTRSRNEPVSVDTDVYLADNIGEMDNLIANAAMVFVGGSLVDHGGHNVLEPAAQGKPVITGPYYKNFIAEVDLLINHQAIAIAKDANDLAATCARLLAQPDERSAMGEAARQAVESSKHVFDRYTAEIDLLIEKWLQQA